ncbi:hypothetical protein NPIL_366331 [Nephila pilipes]|uniref:Uncharacterized protein n=1 Tax=Nephila pilipes TaxID=299642 RepID=A0A8X6TUM7_NEPPI|nr:hypothetical protein NPIL_366331 [Nephila pilipes]
MPKESADWNFWPDRLATQSESKSNGCMNLVIRLRAGNRASSTETVRRGIEHHGILGGMPPPTRGMQVLACPALLGSCYFLREESLVSLLPWSCSQPPGQLGRLGRWAR